MLQIYGKNVGNVITESFYFLAESCKMHIDHLAKSCTETWLMPVNKWILTDIFTIINNLHHGTIIGSKSPISLSLLEQNINFV